MLRDRKFGSPPSRKHSDRGGGGHVVRSCSHVRLEHVYVPTGKRDTLMAEARRVQVQSSYKAGDSDDKAEFSKAVRLLATQHNDSHLRRMDV